MKNTFSVLAMASSAAATFGNFPGPFRGANPFNCPGNTIVKCSEKQVGGFDFGEIPEGPVGQFGGFGFNGFTCKSNGGKRFAPRTGGKSIGGTCHPEKEKSPSFGCGKGSDVESFSLDTLHVQPEFDTDLEFHYDMPDGNTCKHRSPCSKSGSFVKNNQCGGAKNVTIVYPPQPSKPKPTCSVDVHTIIFSCTTSTKPPPSKPTTYQTTTTTSAITKPTEAPPASTYITSFLSTSTVFTTVISTITSCSASAPGCPGNGVTTTRVTVPLTVTECPVTETRTFKPTEQPLTSTSTQLSVSTTTVVPPPVETLPCPAVVPQCLNTFLFQLSCADNSDAACYCPDVVFVKNVYDCLFAHGESAEIIQTAVVFLQGICAPYAQVNPAVVTAATVTQYATVTVTATPIAQAIYTTITVQATQVVPCTDSAGVLIPSSSSTVFITTTLTVPQVGFQTADSTVGVIPVSTFTPVTTIAQQAATFTTPAATTFGGYGFTTASTVRPVGTGAITARPSGVVTVNAGDRATAGWSVMALAVMAVAAAL